MGRDGCTVYIGCIVIKGVDRGRGGEDKITKLGEHEDMQRRFSVSSVIVDMLQPENI